MEWRQFVINLDSIEPSLVEEVLLRHGAQSLTLSDAGNEPVLEPAPGATPLWSDTRLTALFAADSDFARAWEREWLKDFRPMQFGERLWVSPEGLSVNADDAVVVRLLLTRQCSISAVAQAFLPLPG
jgi:ribosomal protein L11 methyltransferase